MDKSDERRFSRTRQGGSMGKPIAIVVGVGAELGLGAALCRRFAEGGHHVLVAGRSADKIEQVVHTIATKGGSAEAVLTDTTREEDVVRLFDRATSPGTGRDPLDLVAYNAGNNRKLDFRDLSAKMFEDFWRIGCFGGFLVGREAARRLVPLGRGRVFLRAHRQPACSTPAPPPPPPHTRPP